MYTAHLGWLLAGHALRLHAKLASRQAHVLGKHESGYDLVTRQPPQQLALLFKALIRERHLCVPGGKESEGLGGLTGGKTGNMEDIGLGQKTGDPSS